MLFPSEYAYVLIIFLLNSVLSSFSGDLFLYICTGFYMTHLNTAYFYESAPSILRSLPQRRAMSRLSGVNFMSFFEKFLSCSYGHNILIDTVLTLNTTQYIVFLRLFLVFVFINNK